jgi:aspartate carbamoyltransferase regulatory subunit
MFEFQLAFMFLSCANAICVTQEHVHHFLVLMQKTLTNPQQKCSYMCPQFVKLCLHKG